MVPQPDRANIALETVPEWFVVFTSYRGSNKLYRRLLPYGFGHVFAFAPIGGGVLLVNPYEGGLTLATTPTLPAVHSPLGVTVSTFIVGLRAELGDVTILRLPTFKALEKVHLSLWLPTCVTVIKSILGVATWAVTPRQLFRVLTHLGAGLVDDAALKTLQETDIAKRQNYK